MFNLLNVALCADVEWLFGADNWQLWSFVAIFLAMLLIGIVLNFTKKEIVPKYAKVSFILFALFALCCLITNLAMEIESEDMPKYQYYFLVGGILLIVSALTFVIGNIIVKDNDKAKKIVKVLALAIMIACAGLCIAGMVTVEKDGWFDDSELFATIGDGGQVAITVVTVLIMIGLIIYSSTPDRKNKKTNNTLAVVYAGISIAMSFALSYARIFKMPAGGSVTVASLLPLVLYSYMFGTKKGVMAGMIYGVLQIMQDPWIVHPAQVLLDYILPFGLIGFSGAFRKLNNKPLGLGLGATLGSLLRYLCHLCSGGLFFYTYMPPEFASSYATPFAWSAVYNTFVFVDIAIVIVVGIVLMFNKQFVKLTTDASNRYLNA